MNTPPVERTVTCPRCSSVNRVPPGVPKVQCIGCGQVLVAAPAPGDLQRRYTEGSGRLGP